MYVLKCFPHARHLTPFRASKRDFLASRRASRSGGHRDEDERRGAAAEAVEEEVEGCSPEEATATQPPNVIPVARRLSLSLSYLKLKKASGKSTKKIVTENLKEDKIIVVYVFCLLLLLLLDAEPFTKSSTLLSMPSCLESKITS